MSKGSLTGVEVLEMAGGWVPERLGATVTTLAFPLSVRGNQWEALSREVSKFIHFFQVFNEFHSIIIQTNY